jgi:ribosomal protein S18 acetylase RimI-like enzyme
VEIIPATDSHVPEILEVWKEFIDCHKEMDAIYTRREDGHLTFGGIVRSLIKADDSLVLVALDDDKVVAFSTCRTGRYHPVLSRGKRALITNIAVTSSHRRRGVGEKLLAEILDWCASNGLKRVELAVLAKNEIGYSFWKKHGFRDYEHKLYLEI